MLAKVVFVCLFTVSANATYCTYSSECYGDKKTCCSDGICRETCHFCSYDSQCGTGECCDSHGNCNSDCPDHGITTGAIIAIVVGCVLIAFMVVSLVACLCCSCCPYYRRRHGHPGVVVHPPGYQEFGARPRPQRRLIRHIRRLRPGLFLVSTRQNTQSPPSSGNNPPNAGFDPPANRHGEPPPAYYPQPQTGSYPSPQAEGAAPYPPLQVQLPNSHPTK